MTNLPYTRIDNISHITPSTQLEKGWSTRIACYFLSLKK